MKVCWAALAATQIVLASTAHAETQYDRSLEQAAVEIAVGKMGAIRGGFSFDARPALTAGHDVRQPAAPAIRGTYSALDPWQDGLAPAVERKVAPSVF